MQTNKQVLFLTILFCCIIIDQTSKLLIDNFLLLNKKIILLNNFLSIEKIYNSGAAFGILQNNTILLILISILTLLVISIFVFKKESKLNTLNICTLSLISGGAIGNLTDRLCYKYVIDFIQVEFISFPIFNFADIFINIGVIIFIISSFIGKNEE